MQLRTKAVQATACAALIVSGIFLSSPKPASADDTTSLLLGAAAIAGVVIYENVQHKQKEATT